MRRLRKRGERRLKERREGVQKNMMDLTTISETRGDQHDKNRRG